MARATTKEDRQLIHEAFAAHAALQPDATALVHEGRRTSYRTLHRASDAYAAALAARGVGAGDLVPIVVPRSPTLVAIQLAVLKCGAAYSNVDGHWPSPRQAAIVRQTATRLVACTSASGSFADLDAFVVPDEAIESVAERATPFEAPPLDGAEAAVVFYTSGSTGAPKGVVVPHRAVTRLFGADGIEGFGPGHVTPQSAAIAWDMHAFEQWGQLTSGGAVALVPDMLLLPDTLEELIATAGVDTLWLTASLFNLFVDEDVDCFRGLRQVLVGGEKVSPKHVRTFLDRHPDIPFHNGYGPAENGMLTTTHRVRRADCDHEAGVPLGHALPHTGVVVIGQDGMPCAAGQVGEICVEGLGLAIGYLEQPELTAQQFPVMNIEGRTVRVYRTGDLGFLDENGVLFFSGRQDRQVKINGCRIEPGEVEIAAQGIPGVRQCRVVPLTDEGGQVTRLGLFFLSEAAGEGPGQDESGVRAELATHLPPYLVPALIRRLDAFPLTLNGKANDEELRRLASATPAPARPRAS